MIVYPAEMVLLLFQNLKYAQKSRTFFAAIQKIFLAYRVMWFSDLPIFCLASMNAPKCTQTVVAKVFGGALSNEGIGGFLLDQQYIPQHAFLVAIQAAAEYIYCLYGLVPGSYCLGRITTTSGAPNVFYTCPRFLFLENGTTLSTTSILSQHSTTDESELE